MWGMLKPCCSALKTIKFYEAQPVVHIGRNPITNSVVFLATKISNEHCKFKWNGKRDATSHVEVTDTSANGTWINGKKIGKGGIGILKEGNEIAFGENPIRRTSPPQEDYRYIFRHMASEPAKGSLHASYSIGHELGRGTFATVMKCLSRTTSEWFAVKIIHSQAHKMATLFAREISILETLQHRNICQLKQVFFAEGLVLELVEGGDLLDYIDSRGSLHEPMAQHFTFQLAEALSYIHEKGIVHRDLKLENILLTTDNPPVIKIADFGLANVINRLTLLKTMCGTPSYIAPEVVSREKNRGYDHLVDSWSVGVIIFMMLTAQSPFVEDEMITDVRTRILKRSIDWDVLESGHTIANHLVQNLLQYFPADRMPLSDVQKHPWIIERGYMPY
ncbi:kinase-like protein [Coniophora puteana RWD-64-598 SS2]|uniref:Kinase-like protein n=1 Tax=Coniophora puteana (strain RWD-64-598) TaxID=741705 RepID=A0A5M3MY93_CONPW|nr:kinase-like protein [Coniophora puteana RWD-64-598 SS2]EIW83744.1 kinase-like protein [Coniophora puteana RWD-64-598 SS2]